MSSDGRGLIELQLRKCWCFEVGRPVRQTASMSVCLSAIIT